MSTDSVPARLDSAPASPARDLSCPLHAYRGRLVTLGSLAVLAGKADAQIVVSDINGPSGLSLGVGHYAYFNPAGAFILDNDLTANRYPFYFHNLGSVLSVQGNPDVVSSLDYALRVGTSTIAISAGQPVDTLPYLGGERPDQSVASLPAGEDYLGFFEGSGGVPTNWGWISFHMSGGNSVLDQVAIDLTQDEVIDAGQISTVPEPPAAILLLSLGAAGVALVRRRNRAAA
jgi:hypothetical protein